MELPDSNEAAVVLPGFVPLRNLCEGDAPAFPSVASARWAINRERAALMEARALAMLGNRMYVHRAKLTEVLQSAAIEACRRHYAEQA